MTFLLVFFFALLPLQDGPGRTVAGVYVEERDGRLTQQEETALRKLHEMLIPLPDTIRIIYRQRDHGFIEKGKGITISTNRDRPPLGNANPPYLYGRTQPTEIGLSGKSHTLLHEIAHFLQWRMYNGKPLLSSPLWWEREHIVNPYRARVETEADLMAAALHEFIFDTSYKVLGYPEQVWAGDVDQLVNDYKYSILDFYRVTNHQ